MEAPVFDYIEEHEEFRDHIATVDQKGKRLWIYPKKTTGKFTSARSAVSWLLLAFLFLVPFIKVNGEPLLLFNIIERRFILFGINFAPQDFHLFVLAMLTLIVFIILFTVVYGRLFCGWVCPQTIFMEGVFRKIEYLIEGDANAQRKLNNGPWTGEKVFKKALKQALFFAVAVLVSNTFLAYIIGADQVLQIVSEPVSQNMGGFVAMIAFSFAFYFVFSYLREQVCVTICPYGRLQGVLLDRNSIVIHYDFVRGEPRGKVRKAGAPQKETPSTLIHDLVAQEPEKIVAEALPAGANPLKQTQKALGDCIDCKLCIAVCPTGIDIRNGTQLECINCTACIDACDEVMDKVKRPRGLIRYDSFNGVSAGARRLFTPRVIAYSVVLTGLLVANIFLLSGRTDVEALVLRTPGMLFQKVDDQHLSNLYNFQIINKTKEVFEVRFEPETAGATIKPIGQIPKTKPTDVVEGAFFIEMEKGKLTGRKTQVVINVYSGDKLIDKVKTNFLGPGY
ncbi:MAG: 4Fe-4S binding protein [Haliscomenobacter sp.]|nr:4Fe-4S binding protein [Haliscomenobacter sp.]